MIPRRVVVLAVALGACSPPSAPAGPKIAAGFYVASSTWVEEQLIVGGFPARNDTSGSKHQGVITVSECDGGRMMLSPFESCSAEIALSSNGSGTLLPGYSCVLGSTRGAEAHRSLGGKVTPTDAGYDFVLDLQLSIDEGATSAKVGGTGSWHFEQAVRREATASWGCDAKPSTAEDDFSADVGCTEPDFVDATADGADRVVRFSPDAGVGLKAVPRCMRIAKGQTVRWVGDFPNFPLGPGKPGALNLGSAATPLPANWPYVSAFHDGTFEFTGDFVFHTGDLPAMTGLIRVR